jgi:hypothetical protein
MRSARYLVRGAKKRAIVAAAVNVVRMEKSAQLLIAKIVSARAEGAVGVVDAMVGGVEKNRVAVAAIVAAGAMNLGEVETSIDLVASRVNRSSSLNKTSSGNLNIAKKYRR